MKIWICIPVFNRVEHTLKCLDSLYKQIYKNFTVVVCDHGSTDNSSEQIKSLYPEVVVLERDSSLWWSGAINVCVNYALDAGDADNDYILTLNNDLVVDPDYLSVLINASERHPHSLITSAVYNNNRQLVTTGLRISWLTSKVRSLDPKKDSLFEESDLAIVTHAPGRGTLIPFQVFIELGLFDAERLPHYGADYDFSFRAARAGYHVIISYRAKVFNLAKATGMNVLHDNFSMSALKFYLTNIKSPANISARFWLAVNNCPRILLPSFLILDFIFVLGSYFKVHLFKKVSNGKT